MLTIFAATITTAAAALPMISALIRRRCGHGLRNLSGQDPQEAIFGCHRLWKKWQTKSQNMLQGTNFALHIVNPKELWQRLEFTLEFSTVLTCSIFHDLGFGQVEGQDCCEE